MKKLLTIMILSMIALLCLSGCQGSSEDTTLMIYMVGSDLESKSGAATRDLDEITAAGVDLSKCNVVVYAGGSPRWHSEGASAECNTLLELTADGFVPVYTEEPASMGDSGTLTGFLSYAYENYPADSYALIMWDHGNGPIIGYGKDMLFDKDSLTLSEMRTALDASPFGGENKLRWVGFDACLMASAELASIMSDYADYLVASQEVEPSFGWNYSFLSELGSTDTVPLLGNIVDCYMAACEDYYAMKGYSGRDTTLSCMDLSAADELEASVEALFSKITPETELLYNRLASKRVNTRALGRASTGSEYDLIDIFDMAEQLEDMYPEEAAALKSAVELTVIKNGTNTVGCCGMSIYYPFFNKYYYEESWRAEYTALGVFPSYCEYLSEYEDIWFDSRSLETNAESVTPYQADDTHFVLELTENQIETFADAKYYILNRDGIELYNILYSGSNIVYENGRITAEFDGNVIYAKNDFNEYVIPPVTEHDTVENITRYSIGTALYKINSEALDPNYTGSDNYLEHLSGHFHIAVDNATGNIEKSSLQAVENQSGSESLQTGKTEEPDVNQWEHYRFYSLTHSYLTRYDNGTVMSPLDWPHSGLYTWYELPVEEGLEFVYAPLTSGDYYILFEITDTRGNRYASEPLPIEVPDFGDVFTDIESAVRTSCIEWNTGDRILLTEESGVAVYLEKLITNDKNTYTLYVENKNDFEIALRPRGFFVNGNIAFDANSVCDDYIPVPANTTFTYEDGFNFSPASLFGMDKPQALRFTLSVEKSDNAARIIYPHIFDIALSDETAVKPAYIDFSLFSDTNDADYVGIDRPVRGVKAEKQVIYASDVLTITLEALGDSNELSNGSIVGVLKFENSSDSDIYITTESVPLINGIVLDGMLWGNMTVPAGSVLYKGFTLYGHTLSEQGIYTVDSLELIVGISNQSGFIKGDSIFENCPITLISADNAMMCEKDVLIFDKYDVRIFLRAYERGDYGKHRWYLYIVNGTEYNINVATYGNVQINGEVSDKYAYGSVEVGAYRTAIGDILFHHDSNTDTLESITTSLIINDIVDYDVVFTYIDPITFTAE